MSLPKIDVKHKNPAYGRQKHLLTNADSSTDKKKIASKATKTFSNMLVLKISNKGFMVNQHSKSINKP